MVLNGWRSVLVFLTAVFTLTHAQECADYGLIDWIKSVGGTFAPQQELRFLDDGVTMGVFATADISEGTVLSEIPWEYIIVDESDETPEEKKQRTFTKLGPERLRLGCATVRKLAQALQDPQPTPYIEYLKAQPRNILPAFWSDQGKALLQDLLGGIQTVSVPPYDLLRPVEYDWQRLCDGGTLDDDNDVTRQALELVVTRADDKRMVPGYDLYNHDNQPNAQAVATPGVKHTVRAIQPIRAGEQIVVSYNMCPECGGRREDYGTPGE